LLNAGVKIQPEAMNLIEVSPLYSYEGEGIDWLQFPYPLDKEGYINEVGVFMATK
jgi:hypothetical protein